MEGGEGGAAERVTIYMYIYIYAHTHTYIHTPVGEGTPICVHAHINAKTLDV